jgi:hypothetical protein
MLILDGEWCDIISLLYNTFVKDFKETKTYHRGSRIIYNDTIKKDGLGKEEVFWHVISKKDKNSGERLIDYPRAKRLPWAKPLMQSPERPEIKVWQYREGTSDKGVRTYIWLDNYNYALILQRKKNVFYWVTAFYVEDWKRRDLLRRYEKKI